MSDFEDVRRIALSLPGTDADGDAMRVHGKGFAWPWRERVEPKQPKVVRLDVISVRTAGQTGKGELLAADPDMFFTEPHYDGYPAVLVRLGAIEVDELREVLTDAWRVQAPKRLVREFDERPDR